jgi:hypothetical protein
MSIWNEYSADTVVTELNINTGTTVVDEFGDTEGKGAIWRYVIDKGSGTNMRAGILKSVWDLVADSTPVQPSDEFGDDIGSTIGIVTFSIDKSASTVRLKMTTTSDDWMFYAVRTLIG